MFFQLRSQTPHHRPLQSRRCQSASPPVTLSRCPRSPPGWPWPRGRPRPGATVRRSSNNSPPPAATQHAVRGAITCPARIKTHLPDCDVTPPHNTHTHTHTGWYYCHVKVCFTLDCSDTNTLLYVNNCCPHAHDVNKHTYLYAPPTHTHPPVTQTAANHNHSWPTPFLKNIYFLANCVIMVVNISFVQNNN